VRAVITEAQNVVLQERNASKLKAKSNMAPTIKTISKDMTKRLSNLKMEKQQQLTTTPQQTTINPNQ
jgi:hypothetical protein